jgi:hypothetical protein
MCGFAGYLSGGNVWQLDGAEPLLALMADTIVSRGPDDFGYWIGEGGIGLAHRRLSVVDLSAAGHQPMTCHTGRYVLAFNGEIYNHLDLRRQIEAHGFDSKWRGQVRFTITWISDAKLKPMVLIRNGGGIPILKPCFLVLLLGAYVLRSNAPLECLHFLFGISVIEC